MKALVLEDDDLFSELLETVVAGVRPGMRVTVARSLAEAFRKTAEADYDLIIADWNLPDGSGLDLVRSLRSDNKAMPIVIVSARADRESVLRAAHYGINGYITKPVDVRVLHQRLTGLLAEAPAGVPPVSDYLAAALTTVTQLPTDLNPSEILELTERQSELSASQLAERWRDQPALTLRLLDVANSASFRRSGEPVETVRDAISSIGVAMALSQALALSLDVSSHIHHPPLRTLAETYHHKALGVARSAQALSLRLKKQPAPFQQAGLLSRLGEMAVIKVLDEYSAQGGALEDGVEKQLLQEWTAPFGNRLKVHWRLPLGQRELIGAVHSLASDCTREDQLLMRAAALDAEEATGVAEYLRLLRRLGLKEPEHKEIRQP
ncbi:response regulator [Marinobacter daepoensis]|uniref:response regulator n=1 Tax=Marinobacter daepoensis TaxID=262077 RepID=UPI001C970466|nr:response regulator [Marinobacter daepoensis]MBY6033706.1 response regulator [Marinobacter daepoensis]